MGNADIHYQLKDLVQSPIVPERLKELVAKFKTDQEHYDSNSYKEAELRDEFLSHLLDILGWDAFHWRSNGYQEREVLTEVSLTVEGSAKAPDYGLALAGRTRCFIEAKKPAVNIEHDKWPAFQLRRYCWTAKLPYGLVTDFKSVAIYDCRQQPSTEDSAATARVAYLEIDNLEEYWYVLHGMFSRESVEIGVLDQLAAREAPPSGTQPIDVAFLAEIKDWRRRLAADIALENSDLSNLEVNSATQRLIDRIVFLRIAEANGLESPGELRETAEEGAEVYQRFLGLFRRADDRYNSGIFHLNGDDRGVDTLGLKLHVSDQVLLHIVSRLYYPEPYEFSVLPPDILGRIYEQFLSEQIVVGEDRSVSVELKPEYRKTGGVYYTPSPIVDYIVQETLGPMLQGKDPTQLRREGFSVADPASGSGSFLIAAFHYLLDWHRDHWAERPKLSKKFLEVGSNGQIRVKTNERKRILTDYIFGVDIDPQAVEVTKLSLLLIVIDGQQEQELAVGRLLPSLEENILCGNSLIGLDFEMPFGVTQEEALQYNPFSWEEGFPEIFARGGFSAVIGNPPYLNVDDTWGKKDPRLAYLKRAYSSIYTDKTDILYYFIQKAAQICRGETGFIVSRSFLEAHKAQKLRGWIAANLRVRAVLDFRHAHVFPNVGINTAIIRLTHSKAAKAAVFARYTQRVLPPGYTPATLRAPENLAEISLPQAELSSDAWNFADEATRKILSRIDSRGVPIEQILHIGKGMETAHNKSFTFPAVQDRIGELTDQGLLYERARNSDIQAFHIRHSGKHLLWVEDTPTFDALPDDVRDHLEQNRQDLEKRAAFVRGNCDWWRFSWPLHKDYFHRARIFCPYRASSNRFALDEERRFLGITDTTVLYDNDQPEDLRYILGLLNTRILTGRFLFIGKLLGGGVLEYYENTVSKLRVPRGKPGESRHDRIVELVKQIEEAVEDRESTTLHGEKTTAQQIIDSAAQEIEEITADLYGLSENDRAILEEHIAAAA